MKYETCCAAQCFRPLRHLIILHKNLTKYSEVYLVSNTIKSMLNQWRTNLVSIFYSANPCPLLLHILNYRTRGLFPMWQVPLCAEILRVSGMMSNQGFSDFERLRHRSPSPMASSNLVSNISGTGFGGWNGLPQEVKIFRRFI